MEYKSNRTLTAAAQAERPERDSADDEVAGDDPSPAQPHLGAETLSRLTCWCRSFPPSSNMTFASRRVGIEKMVAGSQRWRERPERVPALSISQAREMA